MTYEPRFKVVGKTLLAFKLVKDDDAVDPTTDQDGIGTFDGIDKGHGIPVIKHYFSGGKQSWSVVNEVNKNTRGYWNPDSICLESVSAVQSLRDMAEQACETHQQWAEGEVYGVLVHDITDMDEQPLLDSRWGFYGYDYAYGEGLAMLEDAVSAIALCNSKL